SARRFNFTPGCGDLIRHLRFALFAVVPFAVSSAMLALPWSPIWSPLAGLSCPCCPILPSRHPGKSGIASITGQEGTVKAGLLSRRSEVRTLLGACRDHGESGDGAS